MKGTIACATVRIAARGLRGLNRRVAPSSDKELAAVIPARASVANERIETEMRTACGVTDRHGKFIAGVVMITAGYAAEGKYSYFLSTQVTIKIADMELKPGEYVFGSHRTDEQTLELKFYEAGTGKFSRVYPRQLRTSNEGRSAHSSSHLQRTAKALSRSADLPSHTFSPNSSLASR